MEKFLEEAKKFATKPVTTLMEMEQSEELKISGIKTLVASAVIALMISLLFISIPLVNFFEIFFKSFAASVCCTAVLAGVLFSVAKLLKVDKTFKNSLALSANYMIYTAVAMIIYYILQFINAYLAMGGIMFITLFASYALMISFKNSLGGVDENKLTLVAAIVVSIVSIILMIIISNVIASYMMSSLSIYGGGSSTNLLRMFK